MNANWVGKSLDYWEGEVDHELQFYQESPIVKELEMTYEKLLEEKGNLEKSAIIHKKLTEELLQGNNLESIVEVIYKETDTPGIITDDKHNPTCLYRNLLAHNLIRFMKNL